MCKELHLACTTLTYNLVKGRALLQYWVLLCPYHAALIYNSAKRNESWCRKVFQIWISDSQPRNTFQIATRSQSSSNCTRVSSASRYSIRAASGMPGSKNIAASEAIFFKPSGKSGILTILFKCAMRHAILSQNAYS